MASIGLVLRSATEEHLSLAAKLQRWVGERKHTLLLEERSAEMLGERRGLGAKELVKKADPIVVLGGDGTLIGVARHARERSPVMLGVNFGHLGFLTELSTDELFTVLEDVLAGRAYCGRRAMLLAEVERDNKVIFSSQAVNDVVVQKGSQEKITSFDLYVDDKEVMRMAGDGLIFATPTGSTAYSLSAGGVIVHPSLEAVLVTPICAHSLTIRPLVLPMSVVAKVCIPEYERGFEIYVVVDGQVSLALEAGDEVRIGPAATGVCFARSPSRSYFEVLRTKLNWGIPNRGD